MNNNLADRLAAARAAGGEQPGKHAARDDEAADAAAATHQTAPTVVVDAEPPSVPATPSAAPGKTDADAPVSRRTIVNQQQAERLEELKANVHTELLKELGPQLYDADMDQADLDKRVRTVLTDVLGAQDRPISSSDRKRVTQEISDDILGYGPIEPYLRDPDVSEVMVNGHQDVWLEKSGRLMQAAAQFSDEAHLRRTIDKIVSRIGRRVDESSPMVDARLPDGSRVNAVVPPLAVDGSALTIRKFAADPLTVDDLISFGVAEPTDRRLPATPASRAGSTSSCPEVRAPARRRLSTCCRPSSRTTSGSSPSRTPPSSSSSRSTSYGSSHVPRTSRARARSRSATW